MTHCHVGFTASGPLLECISAQLAGPFLTMPRSWPARGLFSRAAGAAGGQCAGPSGPAQRGARPRADREHVGPAQECADRVRDGRARLLAGQSCSQRPRSSYLAHGGHRGVGGCSEPSQTACVPRCPATASRAAAFRRRRCSPAGPRPRPAGPQPTSSVNSSGTGRAGPPPATPHVVTRRPQRGRKQRGRPAPRVEPLGGVRRQPLMASYRSTSTLKHAAEVLESLEWRGCCRRREEGRGGAPGKQSKQGSMAPAAPYHQFQCEHTQESGPGARQPTLCRSRCCCIECCYSAIQRENLKNYER